MNEDNGRLTMEKKDTEKQEIVFDKDTKSLGESLLALLLIEKLYKKKEIPEHIFKKIKKECNGKNS